MKRFEFSLERLLKVKTQLKRLAEADEARARQAVTTAHLAVDTLKVQQVTVADTLRHRLGNGVSPCQWVSVFEQSERMSHQLAAAQQSAATAEANLRAVHEQRKTVSTEVESLTSLRQQKWDEWKRERDSSTQEQLDEVGLRQWMTARPARSEAA